MNNYSFSSSVFNSLLKIEPTGSTDWDNHVEVGTWTNNKTVGTVVNGTSYRTNPSTELSENHWYRYYAKLENNQWTTKIIDLNNDSIVASYVSNNFTINNGLNIYLDIRMEPSTVYFKNIIVNSI